MFYLKWLTENYILELLITLQVIMLVFCCCVIKVEVSIIDSMGNAHYYFTTKYWVCFRKDKDIHGCGPVVEFLSVNLIHRTFNTQNGNDT